MSSTTQCRGCGASIRWVVTPAGKPMPVDARETTIVVVEELNARGDRVVGAPVRGHVPHHITCPKADQFRKRAGTSPA